MKYAGIIKNDITGGAGIQLTFFVQGCPHHCPSCQNPETWDFCGGMEFTNATLQEILAGIAENGIYRCFGVQGGEPLCAENLFLTHLVIQEVRKKYPNIKIYLWTGYYYKRLNQNDPHIRYILDNIDFLIDGPYVEKQRDITLPLRGSRNQSIINVRALRCE